MARHSLIFILVLTFLLPGPVPSQAGSGATVLPGPGLRLLHSNERSLVLELMTTDYQVTSDGPFQRLTVPGTSLTTEPGHPQVPVVGTLLGVPPDAQIELRLLADDAVSLSGRYTLLPAPRAAPLTDDLQPGELIYEPDPAAYASDALYPPAPARIADDAWLRDQRIVRLELYPFQVNPVRGVLLWHWQLRVEVRFAKEQGNRGAGEQGGQGGQRSQTSQKGQKGRACDGREGRDSRKHDEERSCIQADLFEPILRQALLNYNTARTWRGQAVAGDQHNRSYTANLKSKIANRKSQIANRIKIVVDHDALYRLTYTDLQAAGMDVGTVDPQTFGLTSQGQDVAIYVAGEDDGRFDPDDFILFYGQQFRGAILAERYADDMAGWLELCPRCRLAGMFEKYTDENVYWLTAGGEPGPHMATVDGTPADSAPVPTYYLTTVHAEESHDWYTHHFTNEDTWFWDRIQPGPANATRTYTTALTAPATGPLTATVRASIVSRSSNSGHHTQFYLNGSPQPLNDTIWHGKSRHTFQAQVPQSLLLRGLNHLYLPLVTNGPSPDQSGPRMSGETHHTFGAGAPRSQPLKTMVQLDFVVLFNGAFEDMYFDWFEIEYARRFQAEDDQLLFPGQGSGTWQYEIEGFTDADVQVYDITDPLAPRRVLDPRTIPADSGYRLAFQASHDTGARYLAVARSAIQRPKAVARQTPTGLRWPDNGADYIIIAHRQFYDAIQRLADYRASQGLRVIVVDVDDVYDEFNDGIYHPIAIRNFLAYAYANWQPPAPAYVLLVGDGHWNFKGYGVERYGPPEPITMPPNLAFVDPWQGEVDSTNLLAAVVGDDILPDLLIGRLPVNSVEELDAAITKIIAYEQAGAQDWQRHALFVADNVPDPAGDFVSLAEDIIANHLPGGFQADRIYLNDYSCPPSCSAVNAAIVEDLNQVGALLVNYIGHASVDRWAHEQIFVTDDIPSLTNGDRLPVVLSMTCLDGYWIYPNRPSLAEELVRAEDKGAVSTFSPTGLGVATGHHVLQRRFYDAVFQDGVRELGPATLAAKLALFASGGDYDLIHTFTVFGDPALRLGVPVEKVYRPMGGK